MHRIWLELLPSLHICVFFIIPALHLFTGRENSPLSHPFPLSLSSSLPLLHLLSPVVPLKLSVSPSHAKSLCVVFGRTLFSATICLLLLSLSVSLSLRLPLSPSPVVPAKATHRRSFFLLLLLKSWKPCEVVWLSADGRAQRVVSACLCQCV